MSAPGTTKRITFRPPREEDYLGSYLRRHVFQHLLRRELEFDTILGLANNGPDPEAKMLLTDDSNSLSEWQDEAAPHHWLCEFIDSTSTSLSISVLPLRRFVSPPRSVTLHRFEWEAWAGVPFFNSPPVTSPASDTALLMNQRSIVSDERSLAGHLLGIILKRDVGNPVRDSSREA